MGRQVRLLAAGGMGGMLYREQREIHGALRASNFGEIRPGVLEVRREGSVPALYGKVGTEVASVRLGAGYRFSVSLR